MNETWLRNKFQGLTREELRQAGSELGVNFGPNTAEDTMRRRLCEKLGEMGDQPIVIPDEPVKPAPIPMRRVQRPRLAPGDKWEGRSHRVRVHRNEESKNHQSFVLYWDFVARSFKYEDTIDMPEPYFNILKDAKIGRIEQEPELDKYNFRIGTINREVFVPRFSYDYFGVTKGTEDAPGSILEYWQKEARKNDHFRAMVKSNSGRHRLIQIRSDLYGTVGPQFFKDLTNEDIWQDIMRFLGFEDIFYEDLEEVVV